VNCSNVSTVPLGKGIRWSEQHALDGSQAHEGDQAQNKTKSENAQCQELLNLLYPAEAIVQSQCAMRHVFEVLMP
jgi:hypothetical protein